MLDWSTISLPTLRSNTLLTWPHSKIEPSNQNYLENFTTGKKPVAKKQEIFYPIQCKIHESIIYTQGKQQVIKTKKNYDVIDIYEV